MMNTETDHPWTREQMATALADGLRADERARFDAHVAACAACADELVEMKRREADLATLFADARPAPGFEDRLIRSLRETKPRRAWVHPMVRRAAVGVAATILLASAGYVVTSASSGGKLPDLVGLAERVKTSANLNQIATAIENYSNENRNRVFNGGDVFTAPSSNAEMDDFTGRTDGSTTRPGFSDLSKSLSYNYQHPYPAANAAGAGFKNNNSISAEFAVGADADPASAAKRDGVGAGGRSGVAGEPYGVQQQVSRAESAEEKKIPYDEILRSPTNWPDIPQQRGAESSAGRSNAGKDDVAGKPVAGDRPALEAGQSEWRFGRTLARAEAFKPTELGDPVALSDAPKKGKEPEAKSLGALGVQVSAGQQGQPQGSAPAAGAEGVSAAGRVVIADGVEKVKESEQRALVEELAQATPPAQAPPQAKPPPPPQAPQAGPSRKVIRTGAMEFEVDRFDAALAMVTKLTQENGGYVGTTDSEKLPNGKVKGSVIVRVPPDRLDTLVLQLRGIGDLRSQKMDAQDVTKQYTDLEGELRAARAMEERLLEIIKTGKGEIKDLLAAEKELGVWRTKIEKMVGEMRYYDNLVALTTLTITAFERDIRTAALAKETETVQAGIETDDVEGARNAALKAIDEAKGRVIQSDLKRHDAGQFSAVVVADVAPGAAGPLVDRLRQLGKVARFEVQRKQTTPEGTTQPAPGARLERAETRIHLSLYNLANVAPRQTTNLNLAAADVETAYKAIATRVEKAGGRVVTSNLSRPQADQVVGSINFEVRASEAEAVLTDVRALGEVMRLAVTENPDTNNVTTAKQGFVVQLASIAAVPVRESTNLQIAAPDVPAAYNALREAVRAPAVRVSTSQLNEAVRENVTAVLDFEVMRADLPAVEEAIKKLGDVTQRTSGRSGDTENTVDSKVRLQVSFVDADQLPPRETTALGVETSDPDKALADLQSVASGAGGRVIQSNLSQERGGQTIAKLVVDVPLAKSVELITRAKGQGSVRMVQSTKDAQVPDGSLARARIDMTFATSAGIVAPDQGLWASIRRGLATSMTGLMWSLQLIIIGLCFVGPWVLLIMLGWRVLRRKKLAPAAVPA